MGILKRISVDGVSNSFFLVVKKLIGYIYRRVETIVFEFDLSCESKVLFVRDNSKEYDVKRVGLNESLFHLSSKDVEARISKGGKCLTLSVDGNLVGYLWFFYNKHHIAGIGTIDLSKRNAVWVGPAFVHKKYRGNGYNKALIHFLIENHICEDIKLLLTSINSDNTPSIKSFKSMGFVTARVVSAVYKCGKLSVMAAEKK